MSFFISLRPATATARHAFRLTHPQRRFYPRRPRNATLANEEGSSLTEEEELEQLEQYFDPKIPMEHTLSLIQESVIVRGYLKKYAKELPGFNDIRKMLVRKDDDDTVKHDDDLPFVFKTSSFPDSTTHPLNAKAVLYIRVSRLIPSLIVNEDARRKLILVAGARYDPVTNMIKITCDRFPFVNQNKRWCLDAADRLLQESNRSPEEFKEAPLDLAHAARSIEGWNRLREMGFPAHWLPEKVSGGSAAAGQKEGGIATPE